MSPYAKAIFGDQKIPGLATLLSLKETTVKGGGKSSVRKLSTPSVESDNSNSSLKGLRELTERLTTQSSMTQEQEIPDLAALLSQNEKTATTPSLITQKLLKDIDVSSVQASSTAKHPEQKINNGAKPRKLHPHGFAQFPSGTGPLESGLTPRGLGTMATSSRRQ